MARITQVSDTAADPEAAALFTAIKGKIGMVPNLYRVAANQPKVLIVSAKGMIADADLATARESGLTESDIVETVANVVANIFTNYLNHVAATDIDFPIERLKFLISAAHT